MSTVSQPVHRPLTVRNRKDLARVLNTLSDAAQHAEKGEKRNTLLSVLHRGSDLAWSSDHLQYGQVIDLDVLDSWMQEANAALETNVPDVIALPAPSGVWIEEERVS